jgi:hypothetical protein
MTTQIAAYGATVLANKITGNAKTYISSTAPASWYPGQEWYNTGTSTLMAYNGTLPYNTSDWIAASSLTQYICLLTADPGQSNALNPGTPAILVSDLVEDTTTGYTRQAVTWTGLVETSETSITWPATTSNSNNLTYGPYTANQATPVQWAALVSSTSATGGTATGVLLYYWALAAAQQVQISESITIAAGSLFFSQQ